MKMTHPYGNLSTQNLRNAIRNSRAQLNPGAPLELVRLIAELEKELIYRTKPVSRLVFVESKARYSETYSGERLVAKDFDSQQAYEQWCEKNFVIPDSGPDLSTALEKFFQCIGALLERRVLEQKKQGK